MSLILIDFFLDRPQFKEQLWDKITDNIGVDMSVTGTQLNISSQTLDEIFSSGVDALLGATARSVGNEALDSYTAISSKDKIILATAVATGALALAATRNANATRLAYVSAAALGALFFSGCGSENNDPHPVSNDPEFTADPPETDDTETDTDTEDTDTDTDTGTQVVADADGDGFTVEQGDCDDNEPRANPKGLEVCNDGIDNDCNGYVEGDAVSTEEVEGCEYPINENPGIFGTSQWGGAGYAMAPAGDVNGDGNDDVLVSALLDDTIADNAGAAYLMHGPISGAMSVTSAAVSLYGESANDMFGRSVASNGDNYLAVGAPYEDASDVQTGALYVYDTSGNLVAKYIGEGFSDVFGFSAAPAGDVNNDGTGDFLVGSPGYTIEGESRGSGAVYYLTSPFEGNDEALAKDVAYRQFIGSTQYFDTAGGLVTGGGDVDGDGVIDNLVGSPESSPSESMAEAGAATLILNPPENESASLADVGIVFTGVALGDNAGTSGVIDGDVDGDGYDDIAVGASHEGTNGERSGAVYLLRGGPGLQSKNLIEADAIWLGPTSSEVGAALAFSNLNVDGYTDVVVGAPSYVADVQSAAYVVLGPSALAEGIHDFSEADLRYAGYSSPEEGDVKLGVSLAAVGDTDGDGYPDLLVGATEDDTVELDAGAAYLLSGW